MDDVIVRNTISNEEDIRNEKGTPALENSSRLLLLSRPIQKVVLQITKEDNSIATYELVPVNSDNGTNSGATITDTTSGSNCPFRDLPQE